MEVFRLILERRSIRKYRGERVPKDILERILETGRLAPSARNAQPWFFIVVEDDEIKSKLVEACDGQRHVGEAGVVIAVLGDPSISPRFSQDPFIAASFMTLEACEERLGVCWIGRFDEGKVKQLLKVPENLKVVILLTIGYPDEKPEPRPRKPREEIFFLNEFGRPYPFSPHKT